MTRRERFAADAKEAAVAALILGIGVLLDYGVPGFLGNLL